MYAIIRDSPVSDWYLKVVYIKLKSFDKNSSFAKFYYVV